MRFKATIVAGTLLSALVMGAQATVLPYKSFEQLVSEADGVVIGTVRLVQVAAVGKPGNLHTFVTLDDVEALSGQVPEGRLTLRLQGGFDGRHGVRIDGAPSFRHGERVLLFVQGNGRDLVPFVGWTQGVFRLQADAAGRSVVHDADGNEVVGIRQGHVVKRAGQKLDTTVLGAPSTVQQQRGNAPRGGFTHGDGSQAKLVTGEADVNERAVGAGEFAAAVRQKGRAGSVLRSVTPGDVQAADRDQGRDQPASGDTSAAGADARAVAGSVALPQRRRDAAPADAR